MSLKKRSYVQRDSVLAIKYAFQWIVCFLLDYAHQLYEELLISFSMPFCHERYSLPLSGRDGSSLSALVSI